MTHYDTSFLPPKVLATMPQDIEHRHSTRKLSAPVYHDCYVLPRKNVPGDYRITAGVVTADGEYLESSGFHECYGASYDFERIGVPEFGSATAIYLGVLHDCWGHVITDAIKKLWFLHTAEGKRLLAEGAKVVYTTLSNKPLAQYTINVIAIGGGINSLIYKKLQALRHSLCQIALCISPRPISRWP